MGTTQLPAFGLNSIATLVDGTSIAPTMTNPYAGGIKTPLIAPDAASNESMSGGASAFGLLPSTVLQDPNLAADIANAPKGATAFITPLPVGPTGFANDWLGYEVLLFVNFGTADLTDPTLMGQPLLSYGFADDPEFGGNGMAHLIGKLGSDEVFAALVPDFVTATRFTFNDGRQDWTGLLDSFDVLYNGPDLVTAPEPGTPALLGAGLLGLAIVRCRARRS